MRSMIRMAVTGCMALAALSAVAVLEVGSSTAEAAPSVSPFAGTYEINYSGAITISDRGRLTGGYYGTFLSGRVSDDGSYSFTVTESGTNDPDENNRGPRRWKSSYTVAGNMELDAYGNIVGTIDGGGSFFWLRQ